MKDELLLSIMIETYNQEDYIAQTLDSIINQNVGFKYELLIGDDCSNDNTPKILDEYAKKYDFITVFHNEKNLGPMGNYYHLLSECKGTYIMDCAGDDYWLPGKVQYQIDYMEKHPDIGLCYSKAKIFDEKKKMILKKSSGSKREKFHNLMLGNAIPALTVCIRRKVMEEYLNDVKPYEKNWKMEDIPAWLWISYNYKIKFLNKDFGVYRQLEESVSHSRNEEKKIAFEKSCYEIREYYAKKYNQMDVLKQYTVYCDFTKAWCSKDKMNIIRYGKEKLHYKFTLGVFAKIMYACFILK